jgi:cyclopropane fatty-acyl-phospholipid synthase-like methyltransferase
MQQSIPDGRLQPDSIALRALPPDRAETGRGHGLALIFFLLEQHFALLIAIPVLIGGLVFGLLRGPWWVFLVTFAAVPLVGIVIPIAYLVYRSYRHDAGRANWEDVVSFKDPKQAERYRGRKIPITDVCDAYLSERLDFRVDLMDAMLRRNQLFRFCFTWTDIKFYWGKFFAQHLTHTRHADQQDVAPVYDRGNDFYGWFLGPSMVYTSAIFRDEAESLEDGQRRKLDLICQSVQMKPGERHLDIGCGWGALLVHAAKNYGTNSRGITLAKEQAEFGHALASREGVESRVRIDVEDYRLLSGKYDKITCVEMAEHVGIKNFQKFLRQVYALLEDDGAFYLQIAGLRRPWQFEDLVWGLFMSKYIFPGADASCPLGFVVSQAERAGFEVHRVENAGAHYAVTIAKWYDNWKRNEADIVARYGTFWFRLWSLFLAWSVQIGGQGSSALFMLTLTKNTKNDKSTVSAEEQASEAFSRRKRWIGPNPVATQQ